MNRVRSADLAPILQNYCDTVLEGRTLITKKSKVSQKTLATLMRCEEEWVEFDVADRLLCSIGRPEDLFNRVPVHA